MTCSLSASLDGRSDTVELFSDIHQFQDVIPIQPQPLNEQRKLLSAELRRLRRAAGLSGSELAERLGWSQPRISRLETGRQTLTEAEAEDFIRAVGASKAERKKLIDAVRSFDLEWHSTRHSVLVRGSNQRQEEIRQIEAEALVIDSFWMSLVPGLLQIPEYTRAIASVDLDAEGMTPQDIEGAIELRAERQKILKDGSKQLTFLLHESVLWSRYGSSSVLKKQLTWLLEASERFPTLSMGIVPLTANLSVIPMTGYVIFDDKLVNVDTLLGELNFTDATSLTGYRASFHRLSAAAVGGNQCRNIILDVIDSLV